MYFITFEIMIYFLFVLCLRNSLRHGMTNQLKLGVGVLFGLMLEIATIHQLNAYRYGHFLIMVFDVPLCIGMAWSCILYSTMEFSDAGSLPYWLRPILDGLLALNIDLALDAISIRLGFWDWGEGLKIQYFGVPFANFWAWFWVVFFFSMGYRIFARNPGWAGKWLPAPIAFIIGLLGVLGTNYFIVFVISKGIRPIIIAITLAIAICIVLINHPQFNKIPVASVAFRVPCIIHSYILIAGISSGVIMQPVFLLFMGVLMMATSLFLHGKSVREIFAKPKLSKNRFFM